MGGAPPTEPPGAAIRPAIDLPEMTAAYATALAAMGRVPVAVAGYRLFWVRDGRAGFLDLPAGGAYAVAGSHPRCDVVIEGAGVALRHLVAATVALSDGVALRLLDLHTDLPFFLQDEAPQRSIVAAGPVVARLARTVIGAIPVEPGPAQRPLHDVTTLPVTEIEVTHTVPTSVRAGPPSTTRPSTRVSSLPPSHHVVRLAERRAPPPAPAALPDVRVAPPAPAPAEGAGATWTVSLAREDRSAAVDLSDGDLEIGVLIGRSEPHAARCLDGGLQAVLDTNISRGHVLLLHHHDAYEAFDLCSTQGTWRDGQRTRRLLLGDAREHLRLAQTRPVTLAWHGRPAAR